MKFNARKKRRKKKDFIQYTAADNDNLEQGFLSASSCKLGFCRPAKLLALDLSLNTDRPTTKTTFIKFNKLNMQHKMSARNDKIFDCKCIRPIECTTLANLIIFHSFFSFAPRFVKAVS